MDGACILLGVTLLAHAGDNRCSSRSLNDAELERVTAGSTQPKASESEGRGGIIVLNGSSATVVTNSTVDPAPLVPGQVRALNLVNASTSIIANAVNVSVGRADPLFIGLFPPVNQSSQVSQDHRRFAYIEQWSPGGLYVTQSSHHSFSSSHSSSSFFSANTIDRSLFIRRRTINTSTSVPSVGLFPPRISLGGVGPIPPTFTVPRVSFDVDLKLVEGGAAFGPFTVMGAKADFGFIDLREPNLFIRGISVTAPSLQGEITGHGRIGICPACEKGSFDITVNAGGNTVSAPDIALGSNPLHDTNIQVGNGVAGAGSGTITASAGSVDAMLNLGVEASVSVPNPAARVLNGVTEIANKVLDAVGLHIPSLPNTVSLTLKQDFPVSLGKLGLGGFTLSFTDSVFCLGADVKCPQGTATFEEHSEKVKKTTITQSSSSQWTEQSSYQVSQQIVLPPVLTGARGEFFALGGGSLSATDSTSVKLSGPVHQGVRAVNLLTVSGTTLANVANIGTTGLLTPGLALAQLNTISQRH